MVGGAICAGYDLIPFKDKNTISNYARDAFETLVQAGLTGVYKRGKGESGLPDSPFCKIRFRLKNFGIVALRCEVL